MTIIRIFRFDFIVSVAITRSEAFAGLFGIVAPFFLVLHSPVLEPDFDLFF